MNTQYLNTEHPNTEHRTPEHRTPNAKHLNAYLAAAPACLRRVWRVCSTPFISAAYPPRSPVFSLRCAASYWSLRRRTEARICGETASPPPGMGATGVPDRGGGTAGAPPVGNRSASAAGSVSSIATLSPNATTTFCSLGRLVAPLVDST